MVLDIALLILVSVFTIIVLISTINSLLPKKQKNTPIVLNEFTTNFYISELDKIISYKSVYHIDSMMGELSSNNYTIKPEVDNDSILEVCDKIIVDINNTISDNMRTYLINLYGEIWFNDYIKIHTMSIALNYSKQQIENLTLDKFN